MPFYSCIECNLCHLYWALFWQARTGCLECCPQHQEPNECRMAMFNAYLACMCYDHQNLELKSTKEKSLDLAKLMLCGKNYPQKSISNLMIVFLLLKYALVGVWIQYLQYMRTVAGNARFVNLRAFFYLSLKDDQFDSPSFPEKKSHFKKPWRCYFEKKPQTGHKK